LRRFSAVIVIAAVIVIIATKGQRGGRQLHDRCTGKLIKSANRHQMTLQAEYPSSSESPNA
jgi:hypothetical protein